MKLLVSVAVLAVCLCVAFSVDMDQNLRWNPNSNEAQPSPSDDAIDNVITKGSNIEFCCTCKNCQQKGRMCGKTCCTKGSGGCKCKSCSALNIFNMNSISLPESGITNELPPIQDEANTELTKGSNMQFCCSCKKCQRWGTVCGRTCCTKGSGGCGCKSCSAQNIFNMNSISLAESEITNELPLIQDEVNTELTKGSNIEFCCKCKKCQQTGRVCGKTCCTKGSGGCKCKSCSAQNIFNMNSISFAESEITNELPPIQEQENIELTKGGNMRFCCTCNKCQQRARICGRTCCTKGSGGCRCTSCSAQNIFNLNSISLPASENANELSPPAPLTIETKEQNNEITKGSNGIYYCCSCSSCPTYAYFCGHRCCAKKPGCTCNFISCPDKSLTFEANSIKK